MSNELKVTGGNWAVDDTRPNIITVVSPWGQDNPVETSATFGDYRGSNICEMHYNTGVPTKEQALLNAHLIAASKDLYNVLKEVREWYERSGFHTLAPKTPVCFSKALSALQKANPNYKP